MTEIIAHRGDSAHAPENTIAAFERAVDEGAARIELDVRLTSDHEVCVFHDGDLERLTGNRGGVRDYPLAELRRMHVLADSYPADATTTIPALTEVLTAIGPHCPLYIEIKTDGLTTEEVAVLTDRCLELVPPTSPHVLASFDPRVVSRCLQAGRTSALIAIHAQTLEELMPDERRQLTAFSLLHESIHSGVVKTCRERGIALWAWTVDKPALWRRLRALGADNAWCTNDVGALRAWLQREKQLR